MRATGLAIQALIARRLKMIDRPEASLCERRDSDLYETLKHNLWVSDEEFHLCDWTGARPYYGRAML